MNKKIDNLNSDSTDNKSCLVCRELLDNMGRFFEMLDSLRKASTDQWLTVSDISEELKVSKSIVYQLIRSGELEAVNLVNDNGRVAQKGHYRIKRQCLENYIQSKAVRPAFKPSSPHTHTKRFPKVKNHLGL